MRYLELEIGSATLRSGPPGELGPGDARVRVLACGICGTDVHLLRGMVLPRGTSYPVRPGHEVAGVVEAVNAPGSGLAPGELVVLHPLTACGACPACRSGEDQRCPEALILGIQRPGGLADTVDWPAARMLPCRGIDPAAAALLADAAATAHHAVRVAAVPPGGSLCVLGAGGVGGSVLEIARALVPGVRLATVVRSETTAARLAGRGVEVERGLEGAGRALRRRLGRFDAVIDFTGAASAPAEGAAMLARGGRLVLGSLVDAPLALGPSSGFMTQELALLGVYTSGLADLAAVIDLARSGRLDPAAWVTQRRALSQAAAAIELAAARPPGMVRVVVEPD